MKLRSWSVLLSLLQLILFFAALELASRLAYRLKHGHGILTDMSVIPHESLVFQRNPARDTFLNGDPFRVPPDSQGAGKVRIWILGASTSEAYKDGSDWPAQLGALWNASASAPAFIINMACAGYGSSQLHWLYDRYRDAVRPSFVLIMDGENMRGAMTSPHASHHANICSRFDGPLRCASAWLVRHSTLYALLAASSDQRRSRRNEFGHRPTPEETALMTAEAAAWERELRAMLADAAGKDTVFLVLFPNLTMREDAREAASARFPDFIGQWESHRADYEQRIEILRRAASSTGVPALDARKAYMRLTPSRFASFFKDPIHQTSEGNVFLAEALLTELRSRSLEKRRSDASRPL